MRIAFTFTAHFGFLIIFFLMFLGLIEFFLFVFKIINTKKYFEKEIKKKIKFIEWRVKRWRQ